MQIIGKATFLRAVQFVGLKYRRFQGKVARNGKRSSKVGVARCVTMNTAMMREGERSVVDGCMNGI